MSAHFYAAVHWSKTAGEFHLCDHDTSKKIAYRISSNRGRGLMCETFKIFTGVRILNRVLQVLSSPKCELDLAPGQYFRTGLYLRKYGNKIAHGYC